MLRLSSVSVVIASTVVLMQLASPAQAGAGDRSPVVAKASKARRIADKAVYRATKAADVATWVLLPAGMSAATGGMIAAASAPSPEIAHVAGLTAAAGAATAIALDKAVTRLQKTESYRRGERLVLEEKAAKRVTKP
jgi:hypothetical protein